MLMHGLVFCLLELGSGQAQRMACQALAQLLIPGLERRACSADAAQRPAQVCKHAHVSVIVVCGLLELGSGQAQRMACQTPAQLLIPGLERRARHLPPLLSSAHASPGALTCTCVLHCVVC